MNKRKRLLMDKEGFRYVVREMGWGSVFSKTKITPEDEAETVLLYTDYGNDRISLEIVLSTKTKEAIDYQLRSLIRRFNDFLIDKELENYKKYRKI